MVLPGETLFTGAFPGCVECGSELPLKVCRSGAGYYIGTWCDRCGPNTRETGYFRSREEAEKALPILVAELSQLNN